MLVSNLAKIIKARIIILHFKHIYEFFCLYREPFVQEKRIGYFKKVRIYTGIKNKIATISCGHNLFEA